jgi:hypothetical protein
MATWVSSSAMSTCWPSPVFSAWRSAARIATVAYMPVIKSATATPTFCGPPPRSSRSPVTLISPPMPWIA